MAEAGWHAHYNDGRVAAAHPVVVTTEAAGLAIDADGARRAFWPYAEVRLVGTATENPLRLGRLDTPERVTILAADAAAKLAPLCPKWRRAVTRGPAWRLIALWSGSAVAALIMLFTIIVPFFARHASHFITPRLEADLGNRLADTVIGITAGAAVKNGAKRECERPDGEAALAQLTAPLFRQVSLRNPPRIRVVNAPVINALALPGGQILLFKGLLDLADDPNEVAGVIAHELGHLALDHPTTLMIERGAVAFTVGLIAGDVFGVSVMGALGASVLDAGYGRGAESAADARGAALMSGAGYDPRPMAALFDRLAARHADGALPIPFLRDHPASDERARLFRSLPAGGREALDPIQWTALKSICG